MQHASGVRVWAMRTTRFPASSLALLVGLGLLSPAARADGGVAAGNGDGFDTHLFRPAMDSKGFFTTNGTSVLGANDISFGLVLDYGQGLLRVKDQGQSSPFLVENSFQGTFHFNYGIGNAVVVGLSVPVNLMTGDPQVANGAALQPGLWSDKALDSQTVGNAALQAKWRLLRVENGIGLALVGQAGPLLSDGNKAGGADPGFWYWPQLAAEKRFGATGGFKIGANVGYRGHSVSNTTLNLREGVFKDGNRGTASVGVSLRVADPLDLVAETYGTYLMSDASSKNKISAEAVGGIKLFVEKNSFLMLGAGGRYTDGFEAANLRGFLGFIYEPSIGDRDGDGIKDDIDQCPDDPEDMDGFEDEDGCPDPDNDKDGILDRDDRCPNEPEDKDGDEDWDGCPESRDGDRDGDGILDSKDKCPDDPEDKDGFEDQDGCPDPDNDKDGILDKVDQCPNDPEDKDGFEDEDGCPDLDNDKDRIPDVKDACPNEPETYNGYKDEDGCPDKGDVIVDKGAILILKKIMFKTGSADILPVSFDILDQVAGTMKGHPEILLIEVAGHADERANDDYNLKLTQARVDNVVKALTERGVEPARLRSKGYGEYCPEDPRHNAAAWEKNRRVEFKIVKQKGGMEQEPVLGCENAEKHRVFSDPIPKYTDEESK